jgi:hypothetical protein
VLTGIVDLLGGLGIVLPALFRIQPKLMKQKTSDLTFLWLYSLYLLPGEEKQKQP